VKPLPDTGIPKATATSRHGSRPIQLYRIANGGG
jgi:hypothetical protein